MKALRWPGGQAGTAILELAEMMNEDVDYALGRALDCTAVWLARALMENPPPF